MHDTDGLSPQTSAEEPSPRPRTQGGAHSAHPQPLFRPHPRASTESFSGPLIPSEAAVRTGRRPPLLLTVAEVARLLRTTNKAIYAMVERGQLAGPVRRIRRRVLFDQAALVAWMSELSGAPSPEGDRR